MSIKNSESMPNKQEQEPQIDITQKTKELEKALKSKKSFTLIELASIASILLCLGGVVKERFPKVRGENTKPEMSTPSQEKPKQKMWEEDFHTNEQKKSTREIKSEPEQKSEEDKLQDAIKMCVDDFEKGAFRHKTESPVRWMIFDARQPKEGETQSNFEINSAKEQITEKIDGMIDAMRTEKNDEEADYMEELRDKISACNSEEELAKLQSELKR